MTSDHISKSAGESLSELWTWQEALVNIDIENGKKNHLLSEKGSQGNKLRKEPIWSLAVLGEAMHKTILGIPEIIIIHDYWELILDMALRQKFQVHNC